MDKDCQISGHRISGKLIDGEKKAAFFTRLEWVKEQCHEKLGFEPFPGTLNLDISDTKLELLEKTDDAFWADLVPPDPEFCSSRVLPVVMEGSIPAGLIRPSEAVNVHGRQVIEILAPVKLRDVLALETNDRVEIKICPPEKKTDPRIRINGVLFDLDGTLINSTESYYLLVEKTLDKMALPRVDRRVIAAAAQSETFKWESIFSSLPPDTIKEKKQKAWKIVQSLYPKIFLKNVKPFPGTGMILRLLHACGIRIGIVTATPKKNIKEKLSILNQAGPFDFIEQVISSDDTERRKPWPDSINLCLEKMGLEPDQCIYVGDTAIDIKAGRAAGMKTIGVLTGFDSRALLDEQNPSVIIDSILNLPDVLELYQRC